MIRHLHTIDAHTAGKPAPPDRRRDSWSRPARPCSRKRTWARRHADALRRSLMLEPRGHADTCTRCVDHARAPRLGRWRAVHERARASGRCAATAVIAVATIVLERGLLVTREPDTLVLDTPAGQVRALALAARRPERQDGATEGGHVPERAIVRAVRRVAGTRRQPPRARGMWPSGATSTRLWTLRRWACRSRSPACRICAASG